MEGARKCGGGMGKCGGGVGDVGSMEEVWKSV